MQTVYIIFILLDIYDVTDVCDCHGEIYVGSDNAAIPVAAGRLGGAEEAITLVIKGNAEQVGKAINYTEQSKGARLPRLRLANCSNCRPAPCKFPLINKAWARR